MNDQYTEIIIDDTHYVTKTSRKFELRKKFRAFDKGRVSAFIPGTIRDVFAKPGQKVVQGETILVLEAMKMKNNVVAGITGTIKNIFVKTGDLVSKDQLLLEIEN